MSNSLSYLSVWLVSLALSVPVSLAQSTSFHYQGQLREEGQPAQGVVDMEFKLFDAVEGGDQVGLTLEADAVPVVDGLFDVLLDFGESVWEGMPRWLQVGVRPGESQPGLPYVIMRPRQQVVSIPYAVRARVATALPARTITSEMMADGAVTPAKLAQGSAAENLAESGLGGVAPGGIVMSESSLATNLLAAGYERLAQVDLVPERWRVLTNGPPLDVLGALARQDFAAVWTGQEMIVWGGGFGESGAINTGGRYHPMTDTWARISISNAPSPQVAPHAVWTGEEMIVWGNDGPVRGGRYDPETDTWQSMSEAGAPTPRIGDTVVWTGAEMIVWGGADSTTRDTGARYRPSTDTWSPVSTSGAPARRRDHTAVWTGDRMLVWGGQIRLSCGFLCTRVTNYSDGFLYDPQSDTWSRISSVGSPLRRYQHTAVWTGQDMIIWGGNHGDGEGAAVGATNLGSGARYHLATDEWIPLPVTGAPSPRDKHHGLWTGTEMLIYGGQNDQPATLADGAFYRPGGSWRPLETEGAPPARKAFQMIWTGFEVLIWGGVEENLPGTFDDRLVEIGRRFFVPTETWRLMSPSGEPSLRASPTALWADSVMIGWGGDGGEFALRTGGLLDPLANPGGMWRVASLTNAPQGREGHTALWTGAEMLIWGGADGLNEFNTGGRYHLENNTWVGINTNNAPTPRRGHAGIWTGEEMIVWGGFGNGTYLNDGGRYAPASDSWQPIAAAGAPSARAGATAVWTGTEMIVWGGEVVAPGLTSFYFAAGAKWNPRTDTWTILSGEGAPERRSGHTAVWTGTEMLIWGGRTPSGVTQSGARYDPVTDTWQALTREEAPSGREYHTAVWAGSQMLVWGGQGEEFALDTGGRYDPVRHTWQAMDTTDAPALRRSHAGVWSGTEMLIWAGYYETSGGSRFYYDDAFAYSPPRTVFLYRKQN